MYKIYINNTPLWLVKTKKVNKRFQPSKTLLVAPYTGKIKSLLNYVDALEKPNRYEGIVLHGDDPKQCFKDFKSLFTIIKAAGGIVFREPAKTDLLIIHRRGFYDLPKGKIDEDENAKAAALREVREETGVDKLKLGKKVTVTWHTYRDRNQARILKKTNWYKMFTPQKALVPQETEDIDNAFWMTPEDFLSVERKVYGNIKEIIEQCN